MRSIAVGIDGSETSLKAVDFAAGLAAGSKAEVALVTVVDPSFFADQSLRQFVRAEHLTAWGDLVETHARDILALAARRAARHEGLRHRTEWRSGPVAEELARFARENECDMLVVGHVGHSHIVGVIFGSVTVKLLALSPCPLTVVR